VWAEEAFMPAPVPVALRQRVVALYIPRVVTYEMLADLLDIGRATVSRILRLHRETGAVEPKPPAGGSPPILDEGDRRELRAMVDAAPDSTLEGLAEAWSLAHPEKAASAPTLWRALVTMGYTWKKKPSEPGRWTKRRSSGSGRPSSRGSKSRTRGR
jgi:transposase